MSRLVCFCNHIEEREIILQLKKGAKTTADIQRLTGAGTSCGRCLPIIDDLVKSYEKKKPKDQQNTLDFEL